MTTCTICSMPARPVCDALHCFQCCACSAMDTCGDCLLNIEECSCHANGYDDEEF